MNCIQNLKPNGTLDLQLLFPIDVPESKDFMQLTEKGSPYESVYISTLHSKNGTNQYIINTLQMFMKKKKNLNLLQNYVDNDRIAV